MTPQSFAECLGAGNMFFELRILMTYEEYLYLSDAIVHRSNSAAFSASLASPLPVSPFYTGKISVHNLKPQTICIEIGNCPVVFGIVIKRMDGKTIAILLNVRPMYSSLGIYIPHIYITFKWHDLSHINSPSNCPHAR